MTIFEKYLHRQFLSPFLFIFMALTVVAILTQALRELELMTGNRESAIAFLKVVLFSTPLLASQTLPISFFLAAVFMINRFVEDSEAPVAFGCGLSPWHVSLPLLRVGAIFVVFHLILTLWVQPFLLKERRDTIYHARHDLLATIVKSSEFITPVNGITIFARGGSSSVMEDVIIHDSSDPDMSITTIAQRGRIINDGREIVLENGQIQTKEGEREILAVGFEKHRYPIPIEKNYGNDLIYKPSDRYLSDLIFPDLTQFYEKRNIVKFQVEATNRIVQPLMSLAYIMLACGILLGGELPRQGFSRKIGTTCIFGAITLLLTLSVGEAVVDNPVLLPLLIAWPFLIFLVGMLALRRSPAFTIPVFNKIIVLQKKALRKIRERLDRFQRV